jgi:hypothetical protein
VTTAQTLPPMPATDCPSWCAGCRPGDDSQHWKPLVTIGLGGLNPVTVDRIGEALFYLQGEGVMTAEQALNLAAGLTEAVRSLEVSS